MNCLTRFHPKYIAHALKRRVSSFVLSGLINNDMFKDRENRLSYEGDSAACKMVASKKDVYLQMNFYLQGLQIAIYINNTSLEM